MEIWYSHVPPTHPVALCYVEFAKWYASTASANLGSWSVGIPNDPPYAVLVGLKFDLKIDQHVSEYEGFDAPEAHLCSSSGKLEIRL